MFKTDSSEWFHCEVLDILWSLRVQTIEKCRRYVFDKSMEKVRAELALFSVDKARVLHLTSFVLSVLL